MSINPSELDLADYLIQLKRRKEMRKIAKRKIKYALPVILALALFMSFSRVHATTYYNWVQNAGFEDAGGNMILNPSFETGNLDNWTTWAGTPSVSTWSPQNNGTYVGVIAYPTDRVGQVFDIGIPVSYVIAFDFWWYNNAQEGSYNVRVYIGYTNGTQDILLKSVEPYYEGSYHWVIVDLTSDLRTDLTVANFSVNAVEKTGAIDGFELVSSGSGQNTVSPDSFPWYSAEDYLYTGINTAGVAHSGIACYYTGYGEQLSPLCQALNYLPSSSVSSVSLWAWTQSPEDIKVKFTIIYSDRTYTIKLSSGFKDTDGWTELTFSGFVLPNKLIVQIQITIQGWNPMYYSSPSYNHIDDVSVLSTLPSSTVGFYWEAFPSPIENTSISFTQYQGVSEQLTCYVYNVDGDLAGDGTFNVTTSKGTQAGVINGGTFSFPVIGTIQTLDSSESVIIMFNSQGSIFNGTVTLTAYWLAVSGGEGGGDLGLPAYVTNLFNYGIVFAVIFAPPLVVSILVRKVKGDAMIGFIAGLALSIVAGVVTGLVPLWGLFIITLVLAYSIFAKVREK